MFTNHYIWESNCHYMNKTWWYSDYTINIHILNCLDIIFSIPSKAHLNDICDCQVQIHITNDRDNHSFLLCIYKWLKQLRIRNTYQHQYVTLVNGNLEQSLFSSFYNMILVRQEIDNIEAI